MADCEAIAFSLTRSLAAHSLTRKVATLTHSLAMPHSLD